MAPTPEPRVSFRLRGSVPITHLMLVNPGGPRELGGIGFGGLSIGVEVSRLLAIEAGATFLVSSIDDMDWSPFIRAGLSRRIADWRESGARGWTLQLAALLGYRVLTRTYAIDGQSGTETTKGGTIDTGFEFARYFTERTALTLRFLAGLTLPLAQNRTGYWRDPSIFGTSGDLRYALDLAFDVGVAF